MAYTGVGTDPGASPTLLVYADVVGGDNIQGVKLIDATAGSSTPVGTSGNPLWVQTSGTANSLGYHAVAAASNNAQNLKGSAAQLFGVHVFNNATYPIYVKCFNKATPPIVGTDVPAVTIGVQGGTARDARFQAMSFTLGLGVAIVKGIADTDNTSVLSADGVIDVEYV